jgi:hypothetical protein
VLHGDHVPIVPVDGTIIVTLLHAATARYTLHTKHGISGSRPLDRTIGGHHSNHGCRINMVDIENEPSTRGLRCSCNRKSRGSPAVDPLVRRTADLMINDRPGTPTTREDPPSAMPVAQNPNPNGSSSSSSPPRLSLHGKWVI